MALESLNMPVVSSILAKRLFVLLMGCGSNGWLVLYGGDYRKESYPPLRNPEL